jgi:hypothetical protein
MFPQLPQLLSSVRSGTYVPEQYVLHVPAWQLWPAAHVWPQPPQFAGSLWIDAHKLPQSRFGGSQGAGPVQTPF